MKLDALIEEMRGELSAELAAAAELKGPSVHVAGIVPPASRGTEEVAAPKVIVGSGVDPRAELTIVGRRSLEGAEWVFDGVEEEAPLQGIHAPLTRSDAPVERVVGVEMKPRRRAPLVAVAGAAVGVALTWMLLGRGATPLVLRHVPRPVILAAAGAPEGKGNAVETGETGETGEIREKVETRIELEGKGPRPAASPLPWPSWKSTRTRSEAKPRATALETDRKF
ncbi:hypothetical protein [Polyangium mundeleinium]|uniref:Uncharacterized protein n=1 Tax=Polyangium mundeleinium TaxID=2995306 RepID=A0ABT5ESF3_9BACT|nr:hypothetical protein [Polyangium mundeleinium]MDC0744754.1 hypothetical protein [Polyangium mundeleinium]